MNRRGYSILFCEIANLFHFKTAACKNNIWMTHCNRSFLEKFPVRFCTEHSFTYENRSSYRITDLF